MNTTAHKNDKNINTNDIKAPQIAIFGGSFDPFHNGHLAIVEQFLGYFNVQYLFLIPTFCSPFKNQSTFSPQVRLAMCERIATHINAQHNTQILKVCDFEITQNRVTYSIESVRFLSQTQGVQKLYFLLGFDSFVSLAKWREIDELARRVEFVVFGRDGASEADFTHALEELCVRLDSQNLQSTQPSQKHSKTLCAHFLPLSYHIASSSLREDLARFGVERIIGQIPPPLHSLLRESAIIAR